MSAVIYTDDKSALLDAVQRSDERLSATELLSAEMIQERLCSRQPTDRVPENIASIQQQQFLQEWNHDR